MHVQALSVAPLQPDGNTHAARARTFACDLVTVSVGRSPSLALAAQAGASVGYDSSVGASVVRQCPAGIRVAGAAALCGDDDGALASGRAAGADVEHKPVSSLARRARVPAMVFAHSKGKEFVDLDEDLQIGDLLDTIAHGYVHIELVKRFSTAGMGPSQGKHSALPVLAVVSSATGLSPEEVGLTTARPPFVPEPIGVLAASHGEPFRLTPMHDRHIALGGHMIAAGTWLRPSHYGEPGARAASSERETLVVRRNAGMIDVSTLGGIEVRGPEAAVFLERVCAGRFERAPVGSIRYALMVDETGVIIDDGVAARLSSEHFYLTATTSGVDAFMRRLRWWNMQWRMRVDLTAVTTAFAKVNLAGPNSRTILARACEGIDLSPDEFPFMTARVGTVAGAPARILRIGYVGELGYEIHVPTSLGVHVWDAIMEAGKRERVQPFGMDAQRLLRLEKGHFIVGRDIDALSHPGEVGMGALARRSSDTFIGKRSVAIREKLGPVRRLVGFQCERNRLPTPREGALAVRGAKVLGRVTSAGYSPTLSKIIGLALVQDPPEAGDVLDLKIGGVLRSVDVAPTPFYDPKHTRQAV
jgi:sarcosine oxidase subunit alpha